MCVCICVWVWVRVWVWVWVCVCVCVCVSMCVYNVATDLQYQNTRDARYVYTCPKH